MFVEVLVRQARLFPNVIAVTDHASSLSFRTLTSLASVMRKIIARETSCRGVGIMLPSGGAFAGTFFGTLWADKVAVPLNFLLSPDELAGIVRDAGIDLIFSVHHFDKTTASLPARTICVEDLPLKRGVMLARFGRRPPIPAVDPAAMAVLLYTSGTSGAPKGVELSFNNLHANCEAIIEAVGFKDDDRFLSVLPPFHVFGLTANVLVPAVRGLSVRAIPRFSPAAVFRAVKGFGPTVLLAIPSMYAALLHSGSADADALRGFRLLVSGGEPLGDRIAEAFRERFGVELLEGYGLTETSPVISLSTPDRRRHGSVGQVLANLSVRIVGEDGRDLAVEQEGEIVVRGPSVMRGYHNHPAETAKVLDSNGWFATGDIGKLDGDGFLYITGRKKDMIIVGGENVFPREIERVLDQFPAVQEAAVIGVRDESRGEVPVAFVILKPDQTATDADLRNFARRHLAGYKVPREVHVVKELPRGPTGKVSKRELRASVVTVG